jgi:uncharacterized protein (DUF58 family)
MTVVPQTLPPSFTFNGVVRLTRIGTGYLLATVFVGFAAINTGNNSLYIGLCFMLGCLVLSGMASKGGLKHLSAEVLSFDDAWAASPAHAQLRIRNDSRLWNVRDVVITSRELAEPVLVAMVPRRSEVTVDAEFLFEHRGRVELRQLDFYTRYPFGFFLKKRQLRIASDLVVYPRLVDRHLIEERFRAVAGSESGADRIGSGTDVYAFREFAAGDSFRDVYWKKSAGTGRMITKQMELDAARAVYVIVDPYLPPGASLDEFERMVSDATTFVHDAIERELDVVLSLPRVTVRGNGGDAARSMYHALALLGVESQRFGRSDVRDAVVFALGGAS